MKKIIIANWKMNPQRIKEGEKLFLDIKKNVSSFKKTDIVFCPPYIYLDKLRSLNQRSKNIFLGAQNIFWADSGAFTGEISGEMLNDLNVKYVIIGHSERRILGENNQDINKKIKAVFSSGLYPVLCVGENNRDLNHNYFNLVKSQIEECLTGLSKNLISKLIIAYEPVWAISTTINHHDATSKDCLEMTIFIRKILSDKFGKEALKTKIIYGGSVNENDSEDFLKNGQIDGLLVGRASLDAKKFIEIVRIAENL